MSDRPEKRTDRNEFDERRHKRGRRGWIRLDKLEIDEARSASGKRAYEVRIHGVNLRGALSPPTVTVGGQRVREMKFAPDGRTLTGIVDDKPEDEHVVVDYGFVRSELP